MKPHRITSHLTPKPVALYAESMAPNVRSKQMLAKFNTYSAILRRSNFTAEELAQESGELLHSVRTVLRRLSKGCPEWAVSGEKVSGRRGRAPRRLTVTELGRQYITSQFQSWMRTSSFVEEKPSKPELQSQDAPPEPLGLVRARALALRLHDPTTPDEDRSVLRSSLNASLKWAEKQVASSAQEIRSAVFQELQSIQNSVFLLPTTQTRTSIELVGSRLGSEISPTIGSAKLHALAPSKSTRIDDVLVRNRVRSDRNILDAATLSWISSASETLTGSVKYQEMLFELAQRLNSARQLHIKSNAFFKQDSMHQALLADQNHIRTSRAHEKTLNVCLAFHHVEEKTLARELKRKLSGVLHSTAAALTAQVDGPTEQRFQAELRWKLHCADAKGPDRTILIVVFDSRRHRSSDAMRSDVYHSEAYPNIAFIPFDIARLHAEKKHAGPGISYSDEIVAEQREPPPENWLARLYRELSVFIDDRPNNDLNRGGVTMIPYRYTYEADI